ncbi:MAG: histidinol dehydrogenase [Cloacibacillus sp.]
MKIIKEARPRSGRDSLKLRETVAAMIEKVREEGDAALCGFNHRFDGNDRQNFRLTSEEIKAAYAQVSLHEIENMKKAAANIKSFAEAQKKTMGELRGFETQPGVTLGHSVIPVSSCCCYVPGGGYPLYSTALMLIIPAKAAGVGRVAACSPSMKGSHAVHPKTVVAMDIAGADEIYSVGGAQAVAAFAYGTRQIEPVDLIVGPGNQYVAEAKRQCYGQIGIDFVAGPSEVLIIADGSANAEIMAADILAQSEHDSIAKGILVTTSEELAKETIAAVERQLAALPTADIAARSWADYGEVIIAETLDEAASIANSRAPEHLEIIVEDAEALSKKLTNYGSLFIGQSSAEVFGDYVSGTNHTLPTSRAARYTGGVWVGTFLKVCTYQSLTEEAMRSLAPLTSEMARGEGLIAHARAAEIRAELLK